MEEIKSGQGINKQGERSRVSIEAAPAPKGVNDHSGEDSEESFNHRAAVRNWTQCGPQMTFLSGPGGLAR